MKKKKIIATVLEVVIFFVILGGLFLYVQGKTQPTRAYVYSRDITEIGTAIKKSDVVAVEVPGDVVNSGFATQISDMDGKQTDTKVYKGTFVYKSQLIEKGEEDPVDQIDWSKYRLFTIKANMHPAIGRGDMVDLIYIGQGVQSDEAMDESSGNEDVVYSKVFMQNVLVMENSLNDMLEKAESSEEKEEIAQTEGDSMVTLALTLDQIEELTARRATGDIAFGRRTKGAKNYESLGYVMGDYKKKYTGFGSGETGRATPSEQGYTPVEGEENGDF